MKIVAIGGGENGRPGYPYETKEIDEEIVKFSGRKNSNFLFIGFASKKAADSYFSVMAKIFSNLGCNCIHLKERELTDKEITKQKIQTADIIYVGGGNTLYLMNLLRKFGLDKLLKFAGERGAVLCGISAGGICWFAYGNSDSRTNGANNIRVTGLGFIDALFCPHLIREPQRHEDLKRMMKTTHKMVALGLEDCTALKTDGGNYEILKSKPNRKAYKCYYKNGQYIKKEIAEIGKLTELLAE